MRTINRHYSQINAGLHRANNLYRTILEDWRDKITPLQIALKKHNDQLVAEYRESVRRLLDKAIREETQKQQKYIIFLKNAVLYSLFVLTIWITVPAAIVLVTLLIFSWKREKALRMQQTAFLNTPSPFENQPHASELWKRACNQTGYPPVPDFIPVPKLNLVENWWDELSRSPRLKNHEVSTYGNIGEKDLLSAMETLLSNTVLALVGPKVKQTLDADLILLAQNGIWVFDSKYYSGDVSFRNGRWEHSKTIYLKGGHGAREQDEKETPDISREWISERDSIQKTLEKRCGTNFPPVRGGIVFTHREVSLHIGQECPVNTGKIGDWAKIVSTTPQDLNITLRDLCQYADAVLDFSHLMEKDNFVSAIHVAEDSYASLEGNIRSLCEKLQIGVE